MSFHIPIREQCPFIRIWMLPPIIPGRFHKLGTRSVDRLDSRWIADTVMIRSDADNGAVSLMEMDVFSLKVRIADPVEVP